jgi:hypothetical protein
LEAARAAHFDVRFASQSVQGSLPEID